MRQDTPYSTELRAGRILLVDDSPDVRRLVRHYLGAARAEVVEAVNGRAACDVAFAAQNRGEDFDLILLDMEMPELGGHAAATLLRLQGFAGPIVALTACDDAGERERCLASGCTAYLSKPVARDVLMRVVGEHLRVGADDAGDSLQATQLAGPDEPLPAEVEPFARAFVAALPEYAGTVEDLLRRGAIDELARTAHQIKGAAGMYGFGRIYDLAAGAEAAAKAAAALRAGDADGGGRHLRDQVDALVGVIRSTCGGAAGRKEAAGARG
jgi:CheY-like chemotaxis protein